MKSCEGKDENTGKPTDKSYLECGLPLELENALNDMKETIHKIEVFGRDSNFDLSWNGLQSKINVYQIDGQISDEVAQYLRQKYLRLD